MFFAPREVSGTLLLIPDSWDFALSVVRNFVASFGLHSVPCCASVCSLYCWISQLVCMSWSISSNDPFRIWILPQLYLCILSTLFFCILYYPSVIWHQWILSKFTTSHAKKLSRCSFCRVVLPGSVYLMVLIKNHSRKSYFPILPLWSGLKYSSQALDENCIKHLICVKQNWKDVSLL